MMQIRCKWASASQYAKPQSCWIRNDQYPRPHVARRANPVNSVPCLLRPSMCVHSSCALHSLRVAARSCLRHLFFGSLGLLRFGCASYQHRPPTVNKRLRWVCRCIGCPRREREREIRKLKKNLKTYLRPALRA